MSDPISRSKKIGFAADSISSVGEIAGFAADILEKRGCNVRQLDVARGVMVGSEHAIRSVSAGISASEMFSESNTAGGIAGMVSAIKHGIEAGIVFWKLLSGQPNEGPNVDK